MQRKSSCEQCGKLIISNIGPLPKLCAVCRISKEAERNRQRRLEGKVHPPVVRKKAEHKPCVDCGQEHNRKGGARRCQECARKHRRQLQMTQRRQEAAEKSEQQAGQLVIGNNNACAKCAFLVECRNIVDNSVRIGNVLIDPYCFADSPYHHRYSAKYGNTLAGKYQRQAVSA